MRVDLAYGKGVLGVEVSDKELASLPLTRHDFHGDWNYTLTPATAQSNVR